MRPWLIAAFLAAILASGAIGYRQGKVVTEAAYLRDLDAARQRAFDAANLASKKEAERLALEAQRDELARELDAAAYADPDGSRPALSAGSVRRIGRR
ncbi:MAG: hypothetical protein DI533_00480 [Cereibacter sphaeroides]|uniref:Uncharacterized protein n=1 Tax=Cereibacter sphaeroides TaxID=1063 RepID=A0A2W5S8B9_CERSP|nr:MAG: hypothetical protein DI533_00480 [Cereibacter sphaeroides]